jgi:hypothetical protein
MLAAVAAVAVASWASGQGPQAPTRLPAEGRFLYADDDDWDWATPAGANEPCRLSIYGRMPWSALDWMEQGLPEVRGVLIGTPPASGDYLTMAGLNRVRNAGPKRSYEQLAHTPNILANLLNDKRPPNLIILMRDLQTEPLPPVTASEAEAALAFVRRGGRLMVLDDWKCYRLLVEPFLEKKRFPQPPPRDAALRKAVEQKAQLLGSDNFRAREKARAELLKLGDRIVPFLERIKPSSLEEQRRLDGILRALRPPLAELAKYDPWLNEAAQAARAIHPTCRLKRISRNGNQEPGLAICIRLPALQETP